MTAGEPKRSENSTHHRRSVAAATRRSSSSWAGVVAPGLSDSTCLPATMAAWATAARSAGMPASTTRSTSGSARTPEVSVARDPPCHPA